MGQREALGNDGISGLFLSERRRREKKGRRADARRPWAPTSYPQDSLEGHPDVHGSQNWEP
jgi:hypothetical protein